MRVQHYTEVADVDSSAFRTLWYDAPSKRAFAEFNSGTVVGYEGVEASTFQAWKTADSPGTFWRAFVKKQQALGNYKGVDGDVDFQPRVQQPVVQNTPPTWNQVAESSAVEAAHDFVNAVNAVGLQGENTRTLYAVTVVVEADNILQAVTSVQSAGRVTEVYEAQEN